MPVSVQERLKMILQMGELWSFQKSAETDLVGLVDIEKRGGRRK